MVHNKFLTRHNGPQNEDVQSMLGKMGLSSVDQLIDETIPANIRLKNDLELNEGMDEYSYLQHIRQLASKNKIYKTYIGLGYYNTIVPSVILRNVFENPGWYTSYTPYQAEISQGRLEALLNFQTIVSDLTGLPLANSSLLDEGTAAAEAMQMFYNARPRVLAKAGANVFLVSENIFPQTIEVLKTRAGSRGIELRISPESQFEFSEKVFGCMVQYPDKKGQINDYSTLAKQLKEKNIPLAVAADLLSLTLLTPPGEWGADAVFGSSQRFGIPLGYGGPHAAYFATTESYKRQIPGRIIGVSKDINGKMALRMALQTREQHIKREKATSNICTAQALLAIMAGFYGVYHGKDGLVEIASQIHSFAVDLDNTLRNYGYKNQNNTYFDTLNLEIPNNVHINLLRTKALENEMNFLYIDDRHVGISLDETTGKADIEKIVSVLANAADEQAQDVLFSKPEQNKAKAIPAGLQRTSDFMTHPVFKRYRSETQMMRYLKSLENKDLALNRSMIPLGSCTMKLNAVSEMIPVSWPEFTDIHPFVPGNQALGYRHIIQEMEQILCKITGFNAMSFMPNSGAAGEYSGLMVIRAYLHSRGEQHRNICLIPASAHGTNPASSVMAGFKVVVIKTDENGNINIDDLRQKAEQYKDTLGALMVTYPSTHGVFEEGIREIIEIIHSHGGQVYMDGANMNAQVGLTSPGQIGADVCHLNLHKTFATPHGGGGPGAGPIGVREHLVDFLPISRVVKRSDYTYALEYDHPKSIGYIAPFYGNFLVLLRAYAYIRLLGGTGLREASDNAVLNANYVMNRLKDVFDVPYDRSCMHEFVISAKRQLDPCGVKALDIAKALIDAGFHPPTVYFPLIVREALMIEPTETESKETLDRFIAAMRHIAELCETDPEAVKRAPVTAPISRPDELRAVKQMDFAAL